MKYLQKIKIPQKLVQNYNNLLVLAIIILDAISNLLQYIQNLEENIDKVQTNSDQDDQNFSDLEWIIRFSLLLVILIIIIINFLCKKYFKQIQPYRLYLEIFINFIIVEYFIQQIENYQKKSQIIVVYILVNQSIFTQIDSYQQKIIPFLCIILSFIYLEIRLFVAKQFSTDLLIFSLEIFVCLVFSLCFCYDINSSKKQINQSSQQNTPARKLSKMNINQAQKSNEQIKKYEFSNKSTKQIDSFLNKNSIMGNYGDTALNQDSIFSEMVFKSVKLQSSSFQNSQKVNKGFNQICKNSSSNKTSFKHQSQQNQEINEQNIQELAKDENNLKNCAFYFTSFQGIAIFDMQQRVVFENQQLPFILNGFEKKETTEETIKSIKLQKYLVQINDQNLQSVVTKSENQQFEPILDPQSILGNQSEQRSPNNFIAKQHSSLFYNSQNIEQNQEMDKLNHALIEQELLISSNSNNKNKMSNIISQNCFNNLNNQNNLKNDDTCIDICNINNINCLPTKYDDTRQVTKNTNEITQKTMANFESCLVSANSKCDKLLNFDYSNNQYQHIMVEKQNFPPRASQNLQKVQEDISYIESFNNSINQQLLGFNNDEKQNQLQNISFNPKQYQKDYSASSQTNFLKKRNSVNMQENDQQIQEQGRCFGNQYFKKKKGFKLNSKLIELFQNNQDCTIKEILIALLQSNNYLSQQVKEKTNNEKQQYNSLKPKSENQNLQSSYRDTFASFSYKKGETYQVSPFKKNSQQNNKIEKYQKQFEYIVDDDSVLIKIKNDKSNVIYSIKIIILSLYRMNIGEQNKCEELYAFFEFSLQNSDQHIQTEIKIEESKLNQEVFSQTLYLIEKKIKNIIEPSISRIKIFQQYERQGTLNQLTTADHKNLFTTPFFNSILLFNNQLKNLQDYSLISSSQFNLEYSTFSIVDLLINSTNIFSQQAINQNFSLDLKIQKDIQQTVTTDYKRLQQVFINILQNAIQHTNQGKVQIFVTYSENEELFKITVADTGTGLSTIQNQKLFSMFNSQNQNQQFDLKKLIIIPDSNEIVYKDTIQSSQQQKTQLNTYSQNMSSFSYSFAGQIGSTKGDEETNIGFNLFLSNYIIQKLSKNHPISLISELEKGSAFTFCVYDNQNQRLKNGIDTNFKQSQEEFKIQQSIESVIKERQQQLQIQRGYYKHPKNQFNEQIQSSKMKERNNEQKTQQDRNGNSKIDFDSFSNINIKRLQQNNNAIQSPQYKDLLPICNNSKQENNIFTPKKHHKQSINQSNAPDSKQGTLNNKNPSKQKIISIQKDSPNKNRSSSSQNLMSNLNNNNNTPINRAISQVKSLQIDLLNGIDSESCNIASEKNSSIGLVSNKNYQKLNGTDINIVTNKKKDITETQENKNQQKQKKIQNNADNAILVRRSKTLQPIDVSSSRWKSKLSQLEIQYDTYQFGVDIQTIKQNQKSQFYLEHNDQVPINQQNFNHQTTNYYFCDNPMESSNTNQHQNDSFNNISPSLKNFFIAGKSQNIILYNSPNPRSANQDKDILNLDQSKISYQSYQDLFPRQKTAYNRSQTVRQANSEFIFSDPISQIQKSSQQQSLRENDIQKYFTDDSPLFLQSHKVFKTNGEEQQGNTKKITDYGHQTSFAFQVSPTSISKKKQKYINTIFKKKDCGCNSILVIEGVENSLFIIKNNLQKFKLKSDNSIMGSKTIKDINKRLKSSQCCPKYKLIFIDVENSLKKAIKVAKEIINIYNLHSQDAQPFICSCAPNQISNNQILYGEGFDAFDYALQKPIDAEAVFDVLDTALI